MSLQCSYTSYSNIKESINASHHNTCTRIDRFIPVTRWCIDWCVRWILNGYRQQIHTLTGFLSAWSPWVVWWCVSCAGGPTTGPRLASEVLPPCLPLALSLDNLHPNSAFSFHTTRVKRPVNHYPETAATCQGFLQSLFWSSALHKFKAWRISRRKKQNKNSVMYLIVKTYRWLRWRRVWTRACSVQFSWQQKPEYDYNIQDCDKISY